MYFIGAANEELRIILIGTRRNRFAALDVFEVLPDGAPLFRAEIIDEKLPVEMVDLVQDGAGQQAARIELEQAAVQRARLDRDALGAGNIERQAGETEAAFMADDLGAEERRAIREDLEHIKRGEPIPARPDENDS